MDYETEEQQVEALKSWWDENGRSVIAGVIIGVLAIGGFSFWKRHQYNTAVAASDTFSGAVDTLQTGDASALQALAAQGGDTDSLYGAYTALAAARAAVESNDLDTAEQQLRLVAGYGGLDEVALIAKLRLARVLVAKGDAAAALEVLPSNYPDAFTALVEEVRGDVLWVSGDVDAARGAFEKARDSDNVVDPRGLQMKLDDISVVGEAG